MAASVKNPTFAFTYTSSDQNWLSEVDTAGFEAAFVYAGDVELYCRGSPTDPSGGGAAPTDVACNFGGTNPNSFVYYSEFAKTAVKAYKAAGKTVYLNFDGRISPKDMSFVPNFKDLTTEATASFAKAVGDIVCGDANVDGMAWDVEPFSNDQVLFFSELDSHITSCGKRWGVFAFAETFNEDMWTTGLGKSGFLFDRF
jgi:hypothetical protein